MKCSSRKQNRLLVLTVTVLLVGSSLAALPSGDSEAADLEGSFTDATSLVLRPLASGFNAPLGIVSAGDERLFIVEKAGVIRILHQDGTVNGTPFLDIQSQVESGANEQGLLGLVFHPQYETNGYFFVNYIWQDPSGIDYTRISRFERDNGNPDTADPTSEVILLSVMQPAKNHNAGDLAFGPDGYLYIPLGDGGTGGAEAQDGSSLLGTILRIDVDSTTHGAYGVPADNPFVGDPAVEDEIWALGLRNPWRISFDPATGDLYIADVGQLEYEEINVQPASGTGGENYGWPCYEANHRTDYQNGCGEIGDYVFPAAEYIHDPDPPCDAVTGGYVYRGSMFPDLQGHYVLGDYCRGDLWTLVASSGPSWSLDSRGSFPTWLSSFGVDQNGELYAAGIRDGTIYRVQPENPGLLDVSYRLPESLPAETSNLQWYAKVAPGQGGVEGTSVDFVVWLYVPQDFQLPWARQYSFTGDFPTATMSFDWSAVSWISSAMDCPFGGAPETGYKWRAYTGLVGSLPAFSDRLHNELNLRGGLWVPAFEDPGVYRLRVITGMHVDTNGDSTPDSYRCDGIAVSGVAVP